MRFLVFAPFPEQRKRLSQTIIECCRLAGTAEERKEAMEKLDGGELNLLFVPEDGFFRQDGPGAEKRAAKRLALGGLVMDLERQMVFLEKEPLYLTRKEFVLLQYLFEHQGAVMSHHQIMDNVWDPEFDCFSNTLESHILSLRKKIERPGKGRMIQTVFGRGYMFGGYGQK